MHAFRLAGKRFSYSLMGETSQSLINEILQGYGIEFYTNALMNAKVMKKLLVPVIVMFIISSCGSSTEITGSWKADNVDTKKITNVLVTALTDRATARETVESDLVAALRKSGYQSARSMEVLPPTFTASKNIDKSQLLDKIKGTGVDAILTVALLDKETETRYVPGTNGYAPVPRFGYYGMFSGYYYNWYPTLYSPGYYAEDKIYFIETNLYDAKKETLLWSAQSETYNPSDLKNFSREFANIVITRMKRDGILR
jgi:hypothetical protein